MTYEILDIAEKLKERCCSADPHEHLAATRLIEEARDWIAECAWADLEPEDVEALGTIAIVRGIERHYEGGWATFAQSL